MFARGSSYGDEVRAGYERRMFVPEACERGTVGCPISHRGPEETPCETW